MIARLLCSVALLACSSKSESPPQATQESPVEVGKAAFENLCSGCHSIDGTPKNGPSFKGSYGTMVKLSTGAEVLFDDAYAFESIMTPRAKIRAGFPPSQPAFEGQLKESEVNGLIAYIKSLK